MRNKRIITVGKLLGAVTACGVGLAVGYAINKIAATITNS